MADNHTIARPYAQAVFELAQEAGELASWATSLDVAGQLTADGEVAAYLANPEFSFEQRLEFLTGLFASAKVPLLSGSDTKGTNFLKLLIEKRRVGVLPEIAEHFNTTVFNVASFIKPVDYGVLDTKIQLFTSLRFQVFSLTGKCRCAGIMIC